MTSKSFILSARAAIAVAGEGETIADFLEYARETLLLASNGDRPMRAVGDRAELYGQGIHVLGAYVSDEGVNYVRPDARGHLDLMRLGICATIGSGAETLMEMIKNLDRYAPEAASASWLSSFVEGSFAAHVLEREIYYGDIPEDWGGYLETIHFDYRRKSWVRAPRRLHLFFQTAIEEGKLGPTSLIGRIIAYDPGGGNAEVAAVLGDRTEGLHIVRWPLPRILADFGVHETAPENRWSGWAADHVTVVSTAPQAPDGFHCNFAISAFEPDPGEVRMCIEDYSLDLTFGERHYENFLKDHRSAMAEELARLGY